MPSNSKDKGGYEPVPDVENASKQKKKLPELDKENAKEKAKLDYSELHLDDQARLLGTLDEAITHAELNWDASQLYEGDIKSNVDANVSKWTSQAKEFAMGIIQPTITAIITFLMASYLEAQARLQETQDQAAELQDSWVTWASRFFPYVNATLIFASTIIPLQRRCMAMVAPIFAAFSQAEEHLQDTVEDLGPFVDSTIDGIQQDFHKVLEPIKPSLDQIEKNAHMVENILESRKDGEKGFDIPDPSDIDRELDEAQGIVTGKMEEAKEHLQFEDYTPDYLDSPKQFYWRIVFPVIVLAWILQMAVAFGNETWSHRSSSPSSASGNPPGRYLVVDDILVESENNMFPLEGMQANDLSDIRDNATSFVKDSGNELRNKYDEYHDNATSFVKDSSDKLRNQYGEYHDLANSTVHSVAKNISDKLHGVEDDLKDQYNQYKGEFDNTVAQSKSLVQDVLWSYAMALLQMLLIYIVTNEAVQAWVVKQGLKQVQKGAERTLAEYGVTEAMDEVFGKRLGRVRQKILQLLEIYKKVEQILEKAGITSVLPEGTAQKVEETLGVFGKMFKK